ncbi:hypothetical protein Val02_55200 [Virgisporangium aliadipatigenens]|uniref:Uncharacterized protein n=1 Tax=Virgisporangium aliadipatigenens TaxID=741659 RepID=A0A8J3YN71_9ACTN|nr:hypothetical protein [Virgisporangium aliadipatigenens]GIJ48634.1 hypothetical protein Val02_55200 [Virgisporangium aliadipatigenens]
MIRRPSRRVWLGSAVAVWAVLLLVLAVWSAQHGRPTVREQTTIVQALPVVDRAIAAVVTAASGDEVVVSVTGFGRTRARCAAGNRDGESYSRVAMLYTRPGTEGALVERIAKALPGSYDVGVRHAGDLHSLHGDAGFYVKLAGTTVGAGELRFSADTGCRVPGGDVPGDPAVDDAPAALRTAAEAAVGRVGAVPAERKAFHLKCPDGGTAWTVEVSGGGATVLDGARPDAATEVIGREKVAAYRDGGTGVALRLRDDRVVATAGTGCA